MAIEFFRRASGNPGRLGILSGAFNPPTRAHLALAQSGLSAVDEVLFVLPRVFPHKNFDGPGFEDRVKMLLACTAGEPRFSVGAAKGGLYVEIVRECRGPYGSRTEIAALCGRDAAERMVTWDYGHPDAARSMLEEFEMLVASRHGSYEPPVELRHRIRNLPIDPGCSAISATEVRARIRRGDPWRPLVPESIAELVRELYPPSQSISES
ncbi:MAG: nicotinate-nicotinamide nucleotide adenylyltransferase [Bryobacteraceae bacterium]